MTTWLRQPFTLTAAQRDYLASFPGEVTVRLVEQDEEKQVLVHADEPNVDIWVPREGFLSQPRVTLSDPESGIEELPEVAGIEDIEERREEMLAQLPEYTQIAFWHLMTVAENEGMRADWDDLLECLVKGTVQVADHDDEQQGEA